MPTIFTKIIQGDIPAFIIAENENHIAFLDINPLQAGHTLVVPKREEDYIFDLADSELSDLIVFAKKVALAIEKVIDCERIGVSVVGLEVPHTHIHLIPINSVTDMTFGKTAVKMSTEEFKSLAASIFAAYEE
ncbi:MAG: HIT family protein [Saprospirales bacterium]|nr:MAG: HIT family protein [Saprospirales bacterium]